MQRNIHFPIIQTSPFLELSMQQYIPSLTINHLCSNLKHEYFFYFSHIEVDFFVYGELWVFIITARFTYRNNSHTDSQPSIFETAYSVKNLIICSEVYYYYTKLLQISLSSYLLVDSNFLGIKQKTFIGNFFMNTIYVDLNIRSYFSSYWISV